MGRSNLAQVRPGQSFSQCGQERLSSGSAKSVVDARINGMRADWHESHREILYVDGGNKEHMKYKE